MKCLILAAGYATRLYPLTENFPKPLLKVGEKSILDWLVDDLVDTTDIDEFVVISNHKFAQHFVNWKNEKVKTRPYAINVIDDGFRAHRAGLPRRRIEIQYGVDDGGRLAGRVTHDITPCGRVGVEERFDGRALAHRVVSGV